MYTSLIFTLALILVSPLLAHAAPAPAPLPQHAPAADTLDARYLVWDADIATIYFGPNVIVKEGHDTTPVTNAASASALSEWQVGGYLTYPSGPRDFTVRSTVGVEQIATCTLEGRPQPKITEDSLVGFTLFASGAGVLGMSGCGCQKGFRVTCTLVGSESGVECHSWGGAGEACPV